MERLVKLADIAADLNDGIQNMQDLINQVKKTLDEFNEINDKIEKSGKIPAVVPCKEVTFTENNDKQVSNDTSPLSAKPIDPELHAETGDSNRIIPFPELNSFRPYSRSQTRGGVPERRLTRPFTGTQTSRNVSGSALYRNSGRRSESTDKRIKQFLAAPYLAMPDKPLPSCIHDFRPLLQRDGLILLAWDMRITEAGERYTAYWITSAGTPRFYASKPHSSEDFFLARPDRKSYAAEDGIEFYGQEAPAFMVHVAPELMKSNPRHGEQRQTHIQILKHYGCNVDFNYRYLLTTVKKRRLASGKDRQNRLNA